MAAFLCRNCLKRFPAFYVTSTTSIFNFFTSQSAEANLDTDYPGQPAECSSKITRDKLAVLNALASTIQPVPNAPIHGFFEDPFLMPRTSTRKNELIKAREEGKKAAEYVINTYPDLFPLRKPEPEWPKELAINIKSGNEKTLLDLIMAKQTRNAIHLYEKLISKGEPVSLDCENRLLELTGYYGTQQSDTQNELSEDASDHEIQEKQKWSSQNFAHQLFQNMSRKNSRTYEAMILSLLKFQSNKRVVEMYDEMKEKALKGSVFFYNQLIGNSEYLCSNETDPWTFAQEVLQHMNSDPVVKPNLGTFNSLLKVCATYYSSDAYENAAKIIRDMYSLKIEPSLGSYSHLLEAAEKGRDGHSALKDIVAHMRSLNHRFTPESVADYNFFVDAMSTARHFRDGAAARKLFKLVESRNYKAFLGQRPLSFYRLLSDLKTLRSVLKNEATAEKFEEGHDPILRLTVCWDNMLHYCMSFSTKTLSGNLLCSLALSEDANTVMNVYHNLVPQYFVPREWIYIELFRCLEKSKQPHRAIDLYNDIKQHRVNMTVHTCRRIASCFSLKLAKQDLPDYVRVLEEIFQWMEFFDVEADDFMMSQLIRIYCLNGQLDVAWGKMETFSEKNFVPTFPALSSLLQRTLDTKEKEKAMQIFETMAARGFRLDASLRNAYYSDLNFTAEECYNVDQLFSKLPNRHSSR